MASPPSYDETLKYYGLCDSHMREKCSKTVMTAVAKEISGWRNDYLSLGKAKLDAIENSSRKEEEKRQKYLEAWKEVYGFRATYELIVSSFVRADRADLAQLVCEELQKILFETDSTGKYYSLCGRDSQKFFSFLLYIEPTTTTTTTPNTEVKTPHKEPSTSTLNPDADEGRSDGETSPTQSIEGVRHRKPDFKLDIVSEQDPKVADLIGTQEMGDGKDITEPSSPMTPVSAGASEISISIAQRTFAHVERMTRMTLQRSRPQNNEKMEELRERNRQACALLDVKDEQITKLQKEAQQLQEKLDEEHKQLEKAKQDLLEIEGSKDVDQHQMQQTVEMLKAEVMKLKKNEQDRLSRRIGHLKNDEKQVNMEMASTKKEREEIERFRQWTTADIEAENKKLEMQKEKTRRYKLLAIVLSIVLVGLFIYYSPYVTKQNFSIVLY